jgi:hypothetical protein
LVSEFFQGRFDHNLKLFAQIIIGFYQELKFEKERQVIDCQIQEFDDDQLLEKLDVFSY